MCAHAAKRVDLHYQKLSSIPEFHQQKPALANTQETTAFIPIKSTTDNKGQVHVEVIQTYRNYPIFQSDLRIHLPSYDKKNIGINALLKLNLENSDATVNGVLFSNLDDDLRNAPKSIFEAQSAKKALDFITQKYKNDRDSLSNKHVSLIVYVDNERAKWAYKINFRLKSTNKKPRLLRVIVDAIDFKTTYRFWNDLRSLHEVSAGGWGGNNKLGKHAYQGQDKRHPTFKVSRDDASQTCLLDNTDVVVYDMRYPTSYHEGEATAFKTIDFPCARPNVLHNNLYWNEGTDAINGSYSPATDAMVSGRIVQQMYLNWYGIPVLSKDNAAQRLVMLVHNQDEDMTTNAYWDPDLEVMAYGDGGEEVDEQGNYLFSMFPLVSLSITAHEVSHGFTSQHSNLNYFSVSGGLDEAFSDMAAKAAEFYATNKLRHWSIGADIIKEQDMAIRYMDHPTNDCPVNDKGQHFYNGDCSLDNVQDYIKSGESIHYYIFENETQMYMESTNFKGRSVALVGGGNDFMVAYFEDDIRIVLDDIPDTHISLNQSQLEKLLTDKSGQIIKSSQNNALLSNLYDQINAKADGMLAPDPHHTSGIFNKVYYLIATSKDWDPKKAFDIMVQANRFYWTTNANFDSASCDIVHATKDLSYDSKAVINAFRQVGIDASHC